MFFILILCRCAVPFSVACGKCFYCSEGMSARCDASQLLGWRDPETSEGLHGTQSEYIRIPQASGSLYRLGACISDEEGLLLGDIASTAAFAASQAGLAGWNSSNGNSVFALEHLVQRAIEQVDGSIRLKSLHDRDDVAPADRPVYAVVGCGPVGLLAVALSRLMLLLRGYSDTCIYAIDTVPSRLDLARKWGGVPLLLCSSDSQQGSYDGDFLRMSPTDISTTIKAASLSRGRSGRGADAVIECVGANAALLNAYDIVAPCGIVSSIGVHSSQFPFSPSDVYDKNMTYKSGRCPARSLMASVEQLLLLARNPDNGLSCIMVLADVITHKFPLSEGSTGYEIFDKKLDGCIKTVLYPSL